MIAVISRIPKAASLTQMLWKYFNFQLYFSLRPEDGKPSRIRTLGLDETGSADVKVCISVPRGERHEEAFVHELLHAYLVWERYPKFCLGKCWADEKRLAAGAINYAEHFRMKQVYEDLGYDPRLFLSQRPPNRPLDDEDDEAALSYLDGVESYLLTADGYLDKMSAWFGGRRIAVKACFVADDIVSKSRNGNAVWRCVDVPWQNSLLAVRPLTGGLGAGQCRPL